MSAFDKKAPKEPSESPESTAANDDGMDIPSQFDRRSSPPEAAA
jgi:hypothetical protein